MFNKIFGIKKKNSEIDFSQIGLNLPVSTEESIQKFVSRRDNERLGDTIMLGDKGDSDFFI